uniref:Uncharacterized protein n=1 Tax=Rhizophagus irregularis (strain DAOM 181602 / DAOM 197198 / MUCL 43194) TaxID=747089 RepID=U9SZ45_RHIID
MSNFTLLIHSEIRYNGNPINRNWPYNGTFFWNKIIYIKNSFDTTEYISKISIAITEQLIYRNVE